MPCSFYQHIKWLIYFERVPVMNMNSTFFLSNEARKPRWVVIDAKGQILGRLATRIADILRGKDQAYYTPHTDSGNYVVVINAQHIVLTGNKWSDKIYDYYTGWKGGYRTASAQDLHAKKPTELVALAVQRMLPKNILNRQIIRKLKVYAGENHPHKAQLQTSLQTA